VSRLEERLRDAYRGATDAVVPATIRDLGEPAPPRPGPLRLGPRRSWWRGLTPLAAAAAVTAVAVLAALLSAGPGGNQDRRGPVTAPAAGPRFLISYAEAGPLEVRDGATGALVAAVALPTEPGRQAAASSRADRNRTIGSVATADGDHYVVALSYGSAYCQWWLYQFRLNAQGQPSAVTPLAGLPAIGGQLQDLTISGNGQMIGYDAVTCSKPQRSYLTVANVTTGHTRRWSVPAYSNDSVSLTADGSVLYYTVDNPSSVVRAIPTSADPGVAADRGRTIVQADRFGPKVISFAVVTPDGGTVYFATMPDSGTTGQVRALDLATGRLRLVYTPPGPGPEPGEQTADPGVTHLLLAVYQRGTMRVADLDLATGHVSYLYAFPAGLITW
jgi:hypothetical protein